MANNLHISYDLKSANPDYAAVIAAIKELGDWAKIEYSFYYVDSTYTPAQARDHVWKAMRAGDSLYVVDAKTNQAAWMGLTDEVSDFIRSRWHT